MGLLYQIVVDRRRLAVSGGGVCLKVYQSLLVKHYLVCSMGGKGNCYDTAVAERFFHILKVEMVHGESFAQREGMRWTVFEYMELDHNRTRVHSANGYISLLAFENKMSLNKVSVKIGLDQFPWCPP